jgi:hypothetical protein
MQPFHHLRSEKPFMKTPMLSAAVAGITLGLLQTPARASSLDDRVAGFDSPAGSPLEADAGTKHACKGKNACKGQGGCKTDKNACKGQNPCKGQGGCRTDGKM